MKLKFRAKIVGSDKWVYANNIHEVILNDTNESLLVMHPKNEVLEALGEGYLKYKPFIVDRSTISRYTGFKNDGGCEIYIDDIIHLPDHNHTGRVFLNVYHGYVISGICMSVKLFEQNNAVLLGNIHDNKELLK